MANLERRTDGVLDRGILCKQGHNGFRVAFVKTVHISVDGSGHLFRCRHDKLLYGK
jgi:hypothetical protein